MKKYLLVILLGLIFIGSQIYAASFKYGGIKHDLTQVLTAAGTTTLTASSTQVQVATGSSTQTFKFPNATTLAVGYWYEIANKSSGNVTVTDSANATLATIIQNQQANFYLMSKDTAAGTWDVEQGFITSGTQTISGAKTFDTAIQYANGTTNTPGIFTPTGGGNAGWYFGANGYAVGYNGTEVASLAAAVFKFNTQTQMAYASSANSPSLYFGTDSNSGLYRIGSNNWGWSASSAKVLDMSATGLGVTGTGVVTGNADAVQLKVLANSTQTNDLVDFTDSSGNVLDSFNKVGKFANTTSIESYAFMVEDTGSTHTVSFEAPTLTADYTIVPPPNSPAPTANQVMQVNTINGTKYAMKWGTAAGGGSTLVFASVIGNGGATVSNTPIIWPTDTADASGIYSVSTGKVTVPSGKTGCLMRWYTTGDNTNRTLSCYKNAAKYSDGSTNDTLGSGAQNGSCVVDVTSGDLIDVRSNNTMAGNAADNMGVICW